MQRVLRFLRAAFKGLIRGGTTTRVREQADDKSRRWLTYLGTGGHWVRIPPA
jgi:hypothetical protein